MIGRPEVTLADGTVLLGDVSTSGNVLWIWIRDEQDPHNSLPALSTVLSNQEATRQIIMFRGKDLEEFEGFTKLSTVKLYDGVHVCGRLEKEVTEDVDD